jgi:hypothetical protein
MKNTDYRSWVGKKVSKKSGKPFKSKEKTNTVKDIGLHLILSQKKQEPVPCFIFEEDDSYVDCRSCKLADE